MVTLRYNPSNGCHYTLLAQIGVNFNIIRKKKIKYIILLTMFNGRLKITVIGAVELKHTGFMVRLTESKQDKAVQLDPYVALDVDEVAIERTSTKPKTKEPTWNETFTTDLLRNAEDVGFTLFHDAPLPPDDFIANCKVSLSELIERENQPLHEEWVRIASV